MPGSFGISNGHFGERAGFADGFGTGVFLGDFQPELDGFVDVGERFRLRFPLTPAAGQRGTGNRKPFIGWDENHLIFHADRIVPNQIAIKRLDAMRENVWFAAR